MLQALGLGTFAAGSHSGRSSRIHPSPPDRRDVVVPAKAGGAPDDEHRAAQRDVGATRATIVADDREPLAEPRGDPVPHDVSLRVCRATAGVRWVSPRADRRLTGHSGRRGTRRR